MRTLADLGKVKRIWNNARVRVAACSIRGKLRGPTFDGEASLPGDDAATAQPAAREAGALRGAGGGRHAASMPQAAGYAVL